MRRLLARRHRRLPHQRRHRPGGAAASATSTSTPTSRRKSALPLLVETARLWRSLGHHDAHGAFRIDGVTGPDEYSAVADNNIYTNLLAAKNLRGAAEFAERYVEAGEALGVDHEEVASWRDAAEAMTIPYDEELEVHPQSENFTKHARWDFDAVGPEATTRCCSTIPTSTSTASRS